MTFYEFVEEYTDLVVSSHGWCDQYSPFELDSQDYLGFAEKDIAYGEDVHHMVNALGNIKRSLDCRVDTLLSFWGLYKYSKDKRMGFPSKVKLIKDVGIVAPGLITRINTARNKVEHNYGIPVREQVQDYFDVVQIFIGYTNPYLKLDLEDSELMCEERIDAPANYKWGYDGKMDKMVAKFGLDAEKELIVIEGGDNRDGHEDFNIRIKPRTDIKAYLLALNCWYELVI